MPAAPARTAPAAPPPIIPSVRGADTALPLESDPPKTRSKLLLILVILFICGLGAAGGGYYFWQKQNHFVQAKKPEAGEKEEVSDNDRLAALFGDEKAAKKIAAEIGATPAPAQSRPAPVRAAEPVPTPVAARPVPAPPAPPPVIHASSVRFPPLRLQSIFYRPSNPSVIINGKTLFVTDEINGVTVADIQPSSVTLVLSGQTNILTLR
jgi:hypothetical protein